MANQEEVRDLLRRNFSYSNLKLDKRFGEILRFNSQRYINSVRENVITGTFEEAKNYSPFTVAVCYLSQMAFSQDDELVFTPNSFGNIRFDPEFMDRLRQRKFLIPSGVMSGFTFVTSLGLGWKHVKLFTQHGALRIGHDASFFQQKSLSDRDSMACVAKKFVAFAFLHNTAEDSKSARLNRVYSLKMQFPHTIFNLFPEKTIVARSLSDLTTICNSVGICRPSSPSANFHIPIIVISLGYRSYWIDMYLIKLGRRLQENNRRFVVYYHRTECLTDQDVILYQNDSKIFEQNSHDKLKMNEVRMDWWFALSHFEWADNLPESVTEFQMTIPVKEHPTFSYQLNRNHKTARLTILEFANELAEYHEEIASTTFISDRAREIEDRSWEDF